MSPLESAVFNFLSKYCDRTCPILLGFSGGPDSLALLHVLLQYSQQFPIQLGIAHVDHGWRAESADEAVQLQTLIESLGLPFHTRRLSPSEIEGNLEAGCRNERLNFFSELCCKYGYQAVLLGHHADDQAETVLKRVLEGASLPHLSGLRPVSKFGDLVVWRPMLEVTKKMIGGWLEARSLKGIEDWTNLDAKFLRGKFRSKIIPNLSADFGKEISSSLNRLGTEAAELRSYLESQTQPYVDAILKNSIGLFLDLSERCPDALFELKYVFRRFCEQENVVPSFEIVNRAAEFIKNGAADCRLMMNQREIYIDRGRLFLLSSHKFVPADHSLSPGVHQIGPWTIEVDSVSKKGETLNWKALWSEGAIAYLPLGDYHLGAARNAAYPNQSPLYKWWTDHKIPAFLRHIVPVVWKGNEVCHEFLTGRHKGLCCDQWLRVKIVVKLAVEGE